MTKSQCSLAAGPKEEAVCRPPPFLTFSFVLKDWAYNARKSGLKDTVPGCERAKIFPQGKKWMSAVFVSNGLCGPSSVEPQEDDISMLSIGRSSGLWLPRVLALAKISMGQLGHPTLMICVSLVYRQLGGNHVEKGLHHRSKLANIFYIFKYLKTIKRRRILWHIKMIWNSNLSVHN